jgi:hypothetical protein
MLPLGDKAWPKDELSAGLTPLGGDGAVVTVSASTHLRNGPSEEDAEALGALVRRFLEREVARSQRAYIESHREEWHAGGQDAVGWGPQRTFPFGQGPGKSGASRCPTRRACVRWRVLGPSGDGLALIGSNQSNGTYHSIVKLAPYSPGGEDAAVIQRV